jgi:tetratricopeptide (TPR) repeat protein
MFRFIKDLLHRAEAKADVQAIDSKTEWMLKDFVAAVARNPNDAVAYARMGQWWRWKQHYAEALELLNRSIRIDANFAYARCALADLRATCPDAAFRDGQAAVGNALEALSIARRKGRLIEDWQQRMYLRVLAAAYAETGNFDAAIETERQSLVFAITGQATATIQAHLAKYQAREPIREHRGLIDHGPGADSA